ncbi:tetratricopeptide repeat protein [Nonomuraea roseola]|uniref:Tetratricopeptide repeat protein n=1 Tax=Nonomuraea roseola TaxID=46179 RepID=A0ABV5Q613_9ACTN
MQVNRAVRRGHPAGPPAGRAHRQSLVPFREFGDRAGEASTLTNLGIVHEHQGRYEDAHDHHRRALHLYRETGSRIGETVVLNNLGLVCQRQGRYDQARRHHRDALHLCRTFGFPGDEAESLNGLAETARLAQAVDDHDSALALAREVSELSPRAGSRPRRPGARPPRPRPCRPRPRPRPPGP